MRKLIRPSLCLSVIAVGYTLFHWLDAFHLAIGLPMLAVFLILLWYIRSRITSTTRTLELRQGLSTPSGLPDAESQCDPLHETLAGFLQGTVALLLLVGTFRVAEAVPGLQSAFFDHDRYRVELQLDTLENAGNWLAATELASDRLNRPLSRSWAAKLRARLYLALIAAGKQAPAAEAKIHLTRALTLAQEHGLDCQLAEAHLRQRELEAALGDQTRHEAHIAELVRQLRLRDAADAEIQNRLATAESRAETLRTETDALRSTLAETRAGCLRREFGTLIEWGDSLNADPAERRQKYLTALALAQEHGFDTSPLASRLTALDELLRQREPADLPNGTRLEFTAVSGAAFPPILMVDLRVVTSEATFVKGLIAKDFRATAEQSPIPLAAVTSLTPRAVPTQLVVLFDHSNSMTGAPLAEAKAGLGTFLTGVQGTASVQLIAFNSTVTRVSPWSDRPAELLAAVAPVVADGNTALRQAIAKALEQLANRRGPRAIVVFTDGKDTVGGAEPAELISRCRKANVPMHVVALETAELDRDLLAKLANATGGSLTTARQAEHLTARFREMAKKLSQPFYRLALVAPVPPKAIRIHVGGTNAAFIDCPLDSVGQ